MMTQFIDIIWYHQAAISGVSYNIIIMTKTVYRQFPNIRRTQAQNINVSRLVWQLSLPNPMKPGVKLRMKM